MQQIEIQGLSKSYDGGRTYALRDLNLSIKEGEFVAIIGLSGAGKSSLLRALNGVNAPGTGSVQVLGKNVPLLKGVELKKLRRQIGFIFQQFNLVKNLSAIQNVMIGRSAYLPLWRSLTGFFPQEEMERAKQALDNVGLNGRYHEKVRNLSGGQQQRIAIARALVQEPKIILADEPMASLDPKLSELVIGMLAKINQERGITVLMNIHVLELATKYAKRLIALHKGKIVFDGTPAELTREKLEEIYHVDKQLMETHS